jgi:hypothetical protein
MSLFYSCCVISDQARHPNGNTTVDIVTPNFGIPGSSGNTQYQTVGTVRACYDLRRACNDVVSVTEGMWLNGFIDGIASLKRHPNAHALTSHSQTYT